MSHLLAGPGARARGRRLTLRRTDRRDAPVWTTPVVSIRPAKTIIGFWHVGALGDWGRIIVDQYAKLRASGLYDASQKIVVGFVGGKSRERELTIPILDDPKFEVFATEEVGDYEFPTLARVWQEAQDNDGAFLCYYLHTKGASRAATPLRDAANAWRQYMEHFNLERWRDCVAVLDDHDTCGVELQCEKSHYSGNFWWATSDYLKKLPDGRRYWEDHRHDRIAAEFYLCLAGPKAYCFHDFEENLYTYEVSPEEYRSGDDEPTPSGRQAGAGSLTAVPPPEADYTPVSVRFIPEPLVTWADLRGIAFEEPFFRDTLDRASKNGKERWKALTGIDQLRALDDRPTLAPRLFIFQSSRCGSTLLAQMLATLSSNVVVSEASVINDILAAQPTPVERAELLRLVIRALGRNRGNDARHLIVKFSSWNVLSAEMIHRSFPGTPLIWLQRDPIDVVASHADQPAGWTGWREAGASALFLLGLTVEAARAMPMARFRLHAIEALYRAAYDAELPWQVIDYAELPGALWEKIAGHAGLRWDDAEVRRMRARAAFDSKTDRHRLFVARDRARGLSEDDRQFVAERIEPLYRAIGH